MCEWKDKTLLSFFPFGKFQFVLMGKPSKGTEFIEEKRSVAAINNEKTKLPKYGSFAGFRFVEEKEFKYIFRGSMYHTKNISQPLNVTTPIYKSKANAFDLRSKMFSER